MGGSGRVEARGKERMWERMKCIGLVAVLGGSQKMQIDTE